MDETHSYEHQGQVVDLAWSTDGSQLFSASWDGEIRVWQNEAIRTVRETRASPEDGDLHEWAAYAADWSAVQNGLITAETKGIFFSDNGSLPRLVGEGISAVDVKCSPTSGFVALREMVSAEDGKQIRPQLRIRALNKLTDIPVLDSNFFREAYWWSYDIAWAPNGNLLAALAGGVVMIWQVGQHTVSVQRWRLGRWANAIAWLTGNELAVAYGDGNIRIFDRQDNGAEEDHPKCKAELEAHDSHVISISVGMKGQRFATADTNGCICIWDKSQRLVAKRNTELSGVTGGLKISFNPRLPILAYAQNGRVDLLPLKEESIAKEAAVASNKAPTSLETLLQVSGLPRPRILTSDEVAEVCVIEIACETAEEALELTRQLRRIGLVIHRLDLLLCEAIRQMWLAPTREEALALEDIEIGSHGGDDHDTARNKITHLLAEAADNPDNRQRTIAICAYALFSFAGYNMSFDRLVEDKKRFLSWTNSLDDSEFRRQLKILSARHPNNPKEIADSLELALTVITAGFERAIARPPQQQSQPMTHQANENFALVMKGGGLKGLACVGALRELQRFYNFDLYVGTSAGAIIAALLGAGYSADEMESILRGVNFADFLSERLKTITNLLFHGGLFRGTELTNWIDTLLAQKLKSATRVKFIQLIHQVRIYACRRDTDALIFDSKELPRMSVAYAVRCSIAIPFFFTPERDQGLRVFDGGMRHNYPVKKLLEQTPNKKFLGLYLGDPIYTPGEPSIFSDLMNINNEATDAEALEKYRSETVIIDPKPISTLDFALSEEEKTFLLSQGRAAALEFLHANGHIEQDELTNAVELANEHKVAALAARKKRTFRRKVIVGLLLVAAISLGLLWKFATVATFSRVEEAVFPSLQLPASSTPADVFRKARGSIGRVAASNDVSGQRRVSVGTCFIVSNDGYALTAAHIAKEAQSGGGLTVTLGSTSSYEYKASIVKLDDDLDLAIIKLSGSSDFNSLRISRERVQVGDSATVIGFALEQDISLLSGSFASMNILDRFLAISAPVSAGMSGAPVMDRNGDVVGIVRGGFAGRPVGIVVPSRLARAMLTGIIPD